VVGGGPAGLRAAELVSAAGLKTVLTDRMPSAGRKLLVAGKGGLNLTHSEPVENFPARYGEDESRWRSLLAGFSPTDLQAWAKDLGIETFVGTSGRIFPVDKQAAPLLRRWLDRLKKQGVNFLPKHRLTAFRKTKTGLEAQFETSKGSVTFRTRAMILALGGGSWPQTGSDGKWVELLTQAKIEISPLTPANCGYEVDWPDEFIDEADGLPLKNIVVNAGKNSVAGELLITKYGLEGGALYQLGRTLRAMPLPRIEIDLKPDFSFEQLLSKLESTPGKQPPLAKAERAWKLSPAALALLRLQASFSTGRELAKLAKAFRLFLRGPRPIAEAISTAGGVKWDHLDDNLMVKSWPGLFCAGEMIDWDAPTGGYLIQGCLSTATRAANAAVHSLL
jgi:uncharacterized flavoprotein (TIGR03862 family)